MNVLAQLVLTLKFFALITEINSLMVFPKKENDSLTSAAGYHYGLKPPPYKKILLPRKGNKQRKVYRPANVGYKVYENYPRKTTEHFPSPHHYRLPIKKENPKPIYITTTEIPKLKEYPTYNIPKKWAAPVSNAIEEPNSHHEEENSEHDVPRPVIDPAASFPSFGHEAPRKGRIYSKPGEWATPSPDSGINLDFTPVQTYTQVRKTNTVKHVPQNEAFKDATSYEEMLNAPRLKEVLRTKKIQEVYSEEGYEDSGYDHGGHIRHAEHDEAYAAADEGKFKIKDEHHPPSQDSANEETREMPSMTVKREGTTEENQNAASNVEPKITRSRTETSSTSVEYARSPKKYKGSHKFSSKIKSRQQNDEGKVKVKGFAFPPTEKSNSEVWAVPTVFDELSTETSHAKFEKEFTSFTTKANPFFSSPPILEKQGNKINKSKNSVEKKAKAYWNKNKSTTTTTTTTTTEKPENIIAIQKQINNYSSKYLGAPLNGNDTKPQTFLTKNKGKTFNKTSKYKKLHNNAPKLSRLEPYKLKGVVSKSATNVKEFVIETEEDHAEKPEKRIVLPTIGYINSLTSAHFGKESTDKIEDKTPVLTTALNLTEAINYLRFNTKGSHPSPLEETVGTEIPEFEPMKLKRSKTNFTTSKVKRDLENAKEPLEKAETVEEDDSEVVHDKKNDEIAEEERKRLEEENREKEKYEKELNEEITKQEKKILKETLGTLGVIEDPAEKFPSFPIGSQKEKPEDYKFSTTPKPIDVKKYPFYFSKSVSKDSPLRYATHPGYFPRKSGHRMEFYESRDRVMQCPDVNLNLEDIPKSNSTKDSKEQPGENPRIVGLGDKITCLKMKYFDEDPLDSPFFREKEIDYVGKPKRNKQNYQNASNNRKPPFLDSKGAGSVNSWRKMWRNGSKIEQPTNANETTLRYHSSYTYHPNKTLQIMVKDQKAESNAPRGTQIKYHSDGNKIPSQNETSVAETKRIPQVHNNTREPVKDRVIPVKEQVDEPPSNYYIRTSGKLVPPYAPKRKIIRPYYRSPIPMPTRIISTRNKIFIPHNCMHMITKMSALEDERNLIVDCKDATLIQEYRNGVKHIKIMPKIYPVFKPTPKPEGAENPPKSSPQENFPAAKSMMMQKKNTKPLPPKIRPRYPFSVSIKETYADQSDWIPMVSYPPVPNTIVTTISPHRFGRKSDEMIPTTSESISNTSSNHYIIDELKEDEDVRKGEVIEDKAHVFNLMNETESVNTTETTTQGLEIFESLKTKETTKREKRETENPKIRKKSKLSPDKKLLDEIREKKPVEKSLADVIDLGINSPDDFTEKISATNDTTTTTTSPEPKVKINKKFLIKRPKKKSTGKDILSKTKGNKTDKNDDKAFWRVNNPSVLEATTQTSELSTIPLKKLAQVTKHPNSEKGNSKLKKPNELDADDEKLVKTISLEKKIIRRNSTVGDEELPVRRGSRYVEGTDGPILYYVIDKKTGLGKWLTNYEEDETEGKNSKVRSDPGKDSEFEKMNYGSKNDGKVQKRKIRKNFFKRRLNKSTGESNLEK